MLAIHKTKSSAITIRHILIFCGYRKILFLKINVILNTAIMRCIATLHQQVLIKLHIILKERVNAFTIGAEEKQLGYYKEYYTCMYAHLHHVLRCASCGAKPRRRERFNGHCPCPSTVNHCLAKISNEISNLTTSSLICTPCYKHFTSIIQEVNPIKTQNANAK